jgi:RNA polymerase sigma-70 factor (ECF subfamily)
MDEVSDHRAEGVLDGCWRGREHLRGSYRTASPCAPRALLPNAGQSARAEDVTQETLLQAWRTRKSFQGNASLHTWLDRIATNACLDMLRARRRRPIVLERVAHPPTTGCMSPVAASWLEPIPDRLLDQASTPIEDVVGARETVELAVIAAIQYLPPRQRAVFALRDVLGWSARDTANALDSTVAGINSALQRARATIRGQLPAERSQWSTQANLSAEEREVAARFMAAIEAGDDTTIRTLLHDEVRVGHLPRAGGNVGDDPGVYAGADDVVRAWAPLLHVVDPIEIRMVAARVIASRPSPRTPARREPRSSRRSP